MNPKPMKTNHEKKLLKMQRALCDHHVPWTSDYEKLIIHADNRQFRVDHLSCSQLAVMLVEPAVNDERGK